MRAVSVPSCLVLSAVVAIGGCFQPRDRSIDRIEYRGETFKLKQAYEKPEDWPGDHQHYLKDEDLPKIEKLVLEAPLAESYSDAVAVIGAAKEFTFNGFGGGPLPEFELASRLNLSEEELRAERPDDKQRRLAARPELDRYEPVLRAAGALGEADRLTGLKLLTVFLEIPHGHKSRYVTYRSVARNDQAFEPYGKIDDFTLDPYPPPPPEPPPPPLNPDDPASTEPPPAPPPPEPRAKVVFSVKLRAGKIRYYEDFDQKIVLREI